jgi:hypothetical protein
MGACRGRGGRRVVQEIKEIEVCSVEHQIKKINVLCGRRGPTNRPCSLELISIAYQTWYNIFFLSQQNSFSRLISRRNHQPNSLETNRGGWCGAQNQGNRGGPWAAWTTKPRKSRWAAWSTRKSRHAV